MVKVTYLGPDHTCAPTIKRFWLDVRGQVEKCRPFGPEYVAPDAMLVATREAYELIAKEPINPTTPGERNYWAPPPTITRRPR